MNKEKISFNVASVASHEMTEVLRLDKDGMHYKGQVIEDAGEAHKIFVEVFTEMKKEMDKQQRGWVWYHDVNVMFVSGICVGLVWGLMWIK